LTFETAVRQAVAYLVPDAVYIVQAHCFLCYRGCSNVCKLQALLGLEETKHCRQDARASKLESGKLAAPVFMRVALHKKG
jgi:hypothetical protein